MSVRCLYGYAKLLKILWIDQCRKNKKIANLSEEDLINITEQKSLEEKIISDDEKISL